MGKVRSQPNILLVMADQMAAPFLSPWGGPAITPHIERLAESGVTFESTYSNSPLCAPARFAMMAGRRNSRIGAYDNASEFVSTIPTFVHHLRAAGYQTCLVGKMHFIGADQLHGYEERLTTDIYPADFGWTPNWLDPDTRFDWWYHNLDSVVHAGVADVTNQLDYDDDVAHLARRKLRDLARTTDERPWMLTVSFTHPHDPYVARREFWDRYDHDDEGSVPMPTVADGTAPTDAHSERLRHVIGADVTTVTPDQVRTARHAYLANCSYVDDHLGELLTTLDRHGMTDDTVVVFTSDHGDQLGERGLWYKMSFFEHSARVPLVISAPGRFAPRRSTTLSSLLDLAPTLVELGGHPGVGDLDLDGYSLVAQLEGDDDPDRVIEGEYLGEGAVAPIVMLRHGTTKYVYSEPDGAQHFDLATDPDELRDLGHDERWQAEVDRRWDLAAIRDEVLADQADRRTVDTALRTGVFAPWDYQPRSDAAHQYMRNHLDLNDVESGRRA